MVNCQNHHLDSAINILLDLFYHVCIHLSALFSTHQSSFKFLKLRHCYLCENSLN